MVFDSRFLSGIGVFLVVIEVGIFVCVGEVMGLM